MHQSIFDTIVRAAGVASTRRHALRAVAGTALALALGREPSAVMAAGCRGVGKSCRRGGQCCSGLCAGKRRKKRCRRAPNQSICTLLNDRCVTQVDKDCGLGSLECLCVKTSRGRAFCADRAFSLPCRECAGDGDCQAEFGAGAVCVACRNCGFTNGRACAMPCSDPV